MPTMAEQWLHLANGADAWFAIDNSILVPNIIHHDTVLRFDDGSAGYLTRPVDPQRNLTAFVEAHRRHKRLLTPMMLGFIFTATRKKLHDWQGRWYLRLIRKQEIALCTAYLENMSILFKLEGEEPRA